MPQPRGIARSGPWNKAFRQKRGLFRRESGFGVLRPSARRWSRLVRVSRPRPRGGAELGFSGEQTIRCFLRETPELLSRSLAAGTIGCPAEPEPELEQKPLFGHGGGIQNVFSWDTLWKNRATSVAAGPLRLRGGKSKRAV